MAASSSLLIILWSFFPWYFWCFLNYTACQWLAGCLQQVLIQLFQCRSWSSKSSIGRWLFTGRSKKTLRKETVSNYLVAACETIFCNKVLNLFKFSSLVMKQKLEHIWEDPGLKKRAENGHTHEEGEFLPRVMLTAGNGFFSSSIAYSNFCKHHLTQDFA